MKDCWDGPSPQTVRQSWKQPLLYLLFPIWSSVSHLLYYTKQKGITTQIHAQKLTNGVTLGKRGSQRNIKKNKLHISSLADQEGLSLTPLCPLSPHRSPTDPHHWLATSLILLHGSILTSTSWQLRSLSPGVSLTTWRFLPIFFLGLSKEGSRIYSLSPHQTAFKSTAPFRGNCY